MIAHFMKLIIYSLKVNEYEHEQINY